LRVERDQAAGQPQLWVDRVVVQQRAQCREAPVVVQCEDRGAGLALWDAQAATVLTLKPGDERAAV